jgi:hypothetical protein
MECSHSFRAVEAPYGLLYSGLLYSGLSYSGTGPQLVGHRAAWGSAWSVPGRSVGYLAASPNQVVSNFFKVPSSVRRLRVELTWSAMAVLPFLMEMPNFSPVA